MNQPEDVALFKARLDAATLVAQQLIGRVMAGLAGVALVGALLAYSVRPHVHLLSAASVAALGVIWGLAVALAARRGALRLCNVAVVTSVTVPTLAVLVAETLGPLGAASTLFSSFLLLYAFAVAASGLLLRPHLSLWSGALASAQMSALYLWVRSDLEAIALPEKFYYALVSPVPWVFRVIILFAVGVAAAASSMLARRLVADVLEQQRETLAVSRLFGQFVSAEVKDKILRERANLQGERHHVAVLFSDVRGFTSWSERTDPAHVVAQLNAYFSAMVEAIEREGGVVDKFIGDAVMATFGGIIPLENPASAAMSAARSMQAALAQLNTTWEREGRTGFTTGIGVTYGPVIQGPLGSERRREFTVIGDTVNTASRLESMTKEMGCRILIGEGVVRALPDGHGHTLREVGPVKVKGKDEVLRVWTLDS